MGYRVAVVGATGNVGREMLVILEELNFPVAEMYALASRKSMGMEANYGDKTLIVQDAAQFDFSKVDIVLMSVSGAYSKEWAPRIGAAGPIVIDNSSAWRMDPDVPLIVPEVNPDDVAMASRNPAEFLGLGHELGRIAPGYRADLVLADPDLNVIETWIDGRDSAWPATIENPGALI